MKAPAAPNSAVNIASIHEAPVDEDVHRAQRLSRWKKTVAWLSNPDTQTKLDLGATLLQPAMDIIGSIFLGQRSNISALEFAVWDTSPAAQAIVKYSALLCDEHDDIWLPFSRGEWTQEKYHMSLHSSCSLMGHIFLRMVLPFKEWPWPLAEIPSPVTSSARKT